MEGGGSSLGINKGKKEAATRRTWNQMEEQILMELLKEIVVTGWKTENGFRPGYLSKLQQMIREKIPGTDIRANPHIHSRITIWKRHHGCLQTALSDSGAGFNPITKVIDVSDIAWEKAVQKEPSIAGMRHKPWPFYYDWVEVFGCDRATGKATEDVMDAVNELVNEDVNPTVAENTPGRDSPITHNEEACEMDVESQAPTVDGRAKETTSSGKKRPAQPNTDNNKELLDGLAQLWSTSDDRLEKIVINFGDQVSGKTGHESIYSMLERIPGLSEDQLLDASDILSNNPQRLKMFTDFPQHARARYINRLLNGEFDKP